MTHEPLSEQLQDLADRARRHEELYGNADSLGRDHPQVRHCSRPRRAEKGECPLCDWTDHR
jgi:hypothetical protein